MNPSGSNDAGAASTADKRHPFATPTPKPSPTSTPIPAPSATPAPSPVASLVPVTWINLTNATANGNTLINTSTQYITGGGSSQQQILSGSGLIQYTVHSQSDLVIVGLAGLFTLSRSQMPFAITLNGATSAEVWENGAYKSETTYLVGDVLSISVDSGLVRYWKNGSVFYSSTLAASYPLFMDAAIQSSNAEVLNAMISSSGTTLSAAPVITSAVSASGSIGGEFTYAITASNNPTSFGATGLPSGLSINSSTGLISGAPTVAGTFAISLSATNSAGTGTSTLSLNIGSSSAIATNVSAVWANDGADKVTQDEVRATTSATSVINSVWDGSTIKQFGAKNEVVSFNVVLEAAKVSASNVKVTLSNLTGPGGFVLRSDSSRAPSQVFNWTTTETELFYVRYLQITGLDQFGAGLYSGSENQIPVKMRSPTAPTAGAWTSRPNHDKYYPDIAVPIELVPNFSIASGNNQSIWADIYIPKTTASGLYTGTVNVSENGVVTHRLPVSLTVRNFALPDSPNSKTMVDTGYEDVSLRYTGVQWPNSGTSQDQLTMQVLKNQRLLAHRHKISLIGDDATQSGDSPGSEYISTLSGNLYTSANGYAGPGVGVGNNIYSIGTYGSWQSRWGTTQSAIQTHTNNWENWFESQFPGTERFLYLIDESTNYTQTQQWADWMKTNPGVGHNLASMATISAPAAVANVPSLSIATSTYGAGVTSTWQNAVNTIEGDSSKRFYMYNGGQPTSGSFAIEAEGTSMREIAWGQYKKKVSRWFFWEATYYNDYQNGRGNNNLFHVAQTFGGTTSADPNYGQLGSNSSNGNGVLFYPGTDAIFPADSYGLAGPMASLRFKHWRRGIQDVDYLALANAINPSAVTAIVNAVVPAVLWDLQCADNADCSWFAAGTGYSWSPNPDNWEAQRAALAHIIDGQ